MIQAVRTIKGRRWSEKMRHIPYYDNHKEFLERKFDGKIRIIPAAQKTNVKN